MDVEKIKLAGKIAAEAREYAKNLVKPGVSYLEIAEKVEQKISVLGGRPAFPFNISINNIAAHHTPVFGEKLVLKEGDVVKLDLGAHIDGHIADTAVSVSVGKSEENQKLIAASEAALNAAIKLAIPGTEVWQIGKAVNEEIERLGFRPIRNLTGHLVEIYDLHAGIAIPNFNNKNKTKLEKGMVVAIEPFATNGSGYIEEAAEVEIYRLEKEGNMRSNRDILNFIITEYRTLPFAKRWLVNKFGAVKTNLALKEMMLRGIIHPYHALVEKDGSKVAQTEHTILLGEKQIITTK